MATMTVTAMRVHLIDQPGLVTPIEVALGTQTGQLPIGTRVKVGVVGLSLHE